MGNCGEHISLLTQLYHIVCALILKSWNLEKKQLFWEN